MRRGITARLRRARRFLPAAVLAATGWDALSCTGHDGPLVAFLGDSLTEGWGLSTGEAYPSLLARELAERGRPIRALNAGRSGDTVAHGLARLPAVLRRRPDVLVVALGINDALRGMSVEEAERDLRRIVADAKASGARVLLVGVEPPASLATPHARRFASVYPRVASEERVALVPDLLHGASGDPAAMFRDALHPNAAGQRRLAANVRPTLERVLAEVDAGRRAGAARGGPRASDRGGR
jgi:acyl-CoA thioesterase-1